MTLIGAFNVVSINTWDYGAVVKFQAAKRAGGRDASFWVEGPELLVASCLFGV